MGPAALRLVTTTGVQREHLVEWMVMACLQFYNDRAESMYFVACQAAAAVLSAQALPNSLMRIMGVLQSLQLSRTGLFRGIQRFWRPRLMLCKALHHAACELQAQSL
jgi:hypothetical protein